MKDFTHEAVRRRPLDHGSGVQEGAVKPLRFATHNAVESNRAVDGHASAYAEVGRIMIDADQASVECREHRPAGRSSAQSQAFAASLAQASLSVTVRLKTRRGSVESLSTMK